MPPFTPAVGTFFVRLSAQHSHWRAVGCKDDSKYIHVRLLTGASWVEYTFSV
jgi:hypothetical protein